ncbi:hypothetical protein CTheo_8688 [Ceratobasidium theobromae]|uniref:Uncharacterized protein n=1 Tax=Ceratobasidium theobromae TaxID=1582974 RepID=A0A5N5Q7W9_9AGAM|nr:hypothetical protein CTheo_8688 [Ceratobasidium theobromae]
MRCIDSADLVVLSPPKKTREVRKASHTDAITADSTSISKNMQKGKQVAFRDANAAYNTDSDEDVVATDPGPSETSKHPSISGQSRKIMASTLQYFKAGANSWTNKLATVSQLLITASLAEKEAEEAKQEMICLQIAWSREFLAVEEKLADDPEMLTYFREQCADWSAVLLQQAQTQY